MRGRIAASTRGLARSKKRPLSSTHCTSPQILVRSYSTRTLQVVTDHALPKTFFHPTYATNPSQHAIPRNNFTQALEAIRAPEALNNMDLASLLSLLSESAFNKAESGIWPTELLTACFETRACDTASLIKLLPIIKDYVENCSMEESEYILRSYLSKVRFLRMLVLVPHITDIFISRINQERRYRINQPSEEVYSMSRPKAIQGFFNSYLGALKDFKHFSAIPSSPNKAAQSRRLPLIISKEIERVVSYVIRYIEELPSTSDSPNVLGRRIRRTLFSKSVLTPALRSMLLNHIPLDDLQMKEWDVCIALAAAEGNIELLVAFEAFRRAVQQKDLEKEASAIYESEIREASKENDQASNSSEDFLEGDKDTSFQEDLAVGDTEESSFVVDKRNLRPEATQLDVDEGSSALAIYKIEIRERLRESDQASDPSEDFEARDEDLSFQDLAVGDTEESSSIVDKNFRSEMAQLDVDDDSSLASAKVDSAASIAKPRTGKSMERLKTMLDNTVNLHLGSGYDRLEPYLRPEGESSPEMKLTKEYAWSILLTKLSRNKSVTAQDLMEVYEDLEEDLKIPHILTPLMTGLEARQCHREAWEIWRELVFRERSAKKRENPGRKTKRGNQYVDRQALSVATRLYGKLSGLEGALELTDLWAEKTVQSEKDLVSETTRWRNTVVIDDYNINELLGLCRKSGRPDVAMRIMSASASRWGIKPDGTSLKIFIDVCRFTATQEEEHPSISGRFRDLLNHFRSPTSSTDINDVQNILNAQVLKDNELDELAEGDFQTLLESRSSKQVWGDLKPWEYARNMFREIVLTNWPHLKYIKSPLSVKGPFTTLSEILESTSLPKNLNVDLRYPTVSARYTHIIPNAGAIQSYITLLGFFKLHEEIPVVLAWAKELGIQPNTKSLVSALAFICETEGPRRLIRGWRLAGGSKLVRDEEILRKWLESWVEVPVPSEREVADFIRMARGSSESGSLVNQ